MTRHRSLLRVLLVATVVCLALPSAAVTAGAASADPPTGEILSPESGSLLDARTVEVVVGATPDYGATLTSVTLLSDNEFVDQTDVDESGAQTVTLLLDTDGRVGVHELTAVIDQADGESTTTAPVEVTIGGAYTPLAPARILDTRDEDEESIPGGLAVYFDPRGAGGIPAVGVAALVLNVTVTRTESAGYLTVYPAHGKRPVASSLNWRGGETRPNLVVAPLSATGVEFYNGSSGYVDIVVDVEGWISDGTTGRGQHALLTGVIPSRILDTRYANGVPVGPVPPYGSARAQVTGRGGVPSSGVSAVVLNVTVTAPMAAGYLTAYPTGGPPPGASNLNFVRGQTVPNLVVVPVSAAGQLSLFNGSPGSTHVLADVVGYYSDGKDFGIRRGGALMALVPSRLLDTRYGIGAPRAAVPPGGTVVLQVTGRGGVPPSGRVGSAIINVTATAPTGSGYLTVYPGPARPLASNLNFTPGLTVPNLVITPVNTVGQVYIYNGSRGYVHVVADVTGWVSGN